MKGDTELVDATIEQSVVFPGTTIRESTVSHAVLDEHAVIDGVDIDTGGVASHTKIRSSLIRFSTGDFSGATVVP